MGMTQAVGTEQKVTGVTGGHLRFRKKVPIVLWSFQSLKIKALWWPKGEGPLSWSLSMQQKKIRVGSAPRS